jgi:hypothetical protein
MKRLFALALLSFAACQKSAPQRPSGPLPQVPASARTPFKGLPPGASPVPGMPGGPGAPDPIDPLASAAAKGLSDQKVAAYIGYLKDLSGKDGPAVGAAANALMKTGGDKQQLAKISQDDPAMKALKAANEAALAKSGLTQDDVTGLNRLMRAYNRGGDLGAKMLQGRLDELRKRLADQAAQGQQPNPTDLSMEKSLLDNLGKIQARGVEARKTFIANYGQPAADVLDRHSGEYQAAALASAQRMLGKPFTPPGVPPAPAH